MQKEAHGMKALMRGANSMEMIDGNSAAEPQNNIQIARDQLVDVSKAKLLGVSVEEMHKRIAKATNSSEIYKALEFK